jgi:hypothetical protein
MCGVKKKALDTTHSDFKNLYLYERNQNSLWYCLVKGREGCFHKLNFAELRVIKNDRYMCSMFIENSED